MRAARRKAHATRSPSAGLLPLGSGGSGTSSPKLRAMAVVHEEPPATFGSPALQSLIYATSNDRFPGAPGTLLHRAKLEAARALAAKQREAQREHERREEMKRLGILGVGKKRVTSNAANGRFATPPVSSDRARRSAAATTAAASSANGNGASSSSSSSSSSHTNGGRTARSNGRSVANAIDHSSLPVPATATTSAAATNAAAAAPSASQQAQAAPPNGASSPLLSSSGRLRRPAAGSRGASPMPLTGMATRNRSPIVPPLELDDKEAAGPSLLGPNSGSVMV